MEDPEPADEERPEVDEHENIALLANCDVSLAGVTILPKPRVSREAMVDVLKGHNDILRALRTDLTCLTQTVKQLASECAETRQRTEELHTMQGEQRREISALSDRTSSIEEVTEELTVKLASLDSMTQAIEVHGKQISKLETLHTKEEEINREFREDTSERVEAVTEKADRLGRTVESQQRRLESMGEEIQITSDQVTYTRPAEAGEAHGDEYVLSDVLTETRATVAKHTDVLEVQRKALRHHGEELERKATVDIEAIVSEHDDHLERIQRKLEADSDIDLSDIRRNQEILTGTLETIQTDMLEKTDKAEVDRKIEVKYEEILDHLQNALNATEEDEEDFKAATDTLNTAVEQLRANKADKSDIMAMKQLLSELSKTLHPKQQQHQHQTGGGMMATASLEERPTREELSFLLDDKADRTALDALSANVTDSLQDLHQRLYQLMTSSSPSPDVIPSSRKDTEASGNPSFNVPAMTSQQEQSMDQTQQQQQQQQFPQQQQQQQQQFPQQQQLSSPSTEKQQREMPVSSSSHTPSASKSKPVEQQELDDRNPVTLTPPKPFISPSVPKRGGTTTTTVTFPPIQPPPSSTLQQQQHRQAERLVPGQQEYRLKDMERQIAELQAWVVQLVEKASRPRSRGEGLKRSISSEFLSKSSQHSTSLHCLSCDQPVTSQPRHSFHGHTLGGGYQLRSPQRDGSPVTQFPEIDKEAYFNEQREVAEGTMGVEGIDGKLYRSDAVKKRRPRSRNGDTREAPLKETHQPPR